MAKKKKDNKKGALLLGALLIGGVALSRKKGSLGPSTGGVTGGNIGKYYTVGDVIESQKARELNISEQFGPLPKEIRDNARFYAENVLDPLTEHLGKKVPFSSWYRHPKTNEAVGGAETSLHLKALATDTEDDPELPELLRGIFIKGIPYHKVIISGSANNPTAVHISLKKAGNANKILGKDGNGNYYPIDKNYLMQKLGLTVQI
jgi:zinc D-Ala-D-Ala carboxypeptidase